MCVTPKSQGYLFAQKPSPFSILVCVSVLLSTLNHRKSGLEHQIEVTNLKLSRAEQLLACSGGERERWAMEAQGKLEALSCLPGDIFLAATVIAYLGPFEDSFRRESIQAWNAAAVRLHIPCSNPFDFASVLGDPVQIRAWNIAGVCCTMLCCAALSDVVCIGM